MHTTIAGLAAPAASASDPCSLLTDAELARLAPRVGHGKLDRLTAGLAALTVRPGDRVIGLTTPRMDVRQDPPAFALVKTLAAKALARLKAGR